MLMQLIIKPQMGMSFIPHSSLNGQPFLHPYVVYCFQCPCDLIYIGTTIKKALCRVLEHMRAIAKQDVTYPVARHFSAAHNSDRNLLRFYCIDRVPPNVRGGDRTRKLRQLELCYIIRLQTKAPGGLNMDEELAVHLG